MRLRNLAILGFGLAAVLLLVGLPSLGQGVTDPTGELADAECYGHHKQEGFRSMDLFPTLVDTVPKGGVFEFQMRITNPWLHDLKDVSAYVDVSNAPGIALEGGKDPVEQTKKAETIDGGPTKYSFKDYQVPVDANATELIAHIVGQPGTQIPAPVVRDRRADFDITLTSPDGKTKFDGHPINANADMLQDTNTPVQDVELHVPQRNITAGGPGPWKLTVAYRGSDQQGVYDLYTGVFYNQTGIITMPGPAILKPNEHADFTFKLKVKDVDGLQHMRYGGIGTAYHQHTDKNIGDIGHYDKWATMQFDTGAQLHVLGSAQVAGGGADTLGPILRRWGQVTGFAGSFLLIPSLVFGGTFGKSTVVTMNQWFGGPRRRVLFHNSMSFWLLGISVIHTYIFFYETFWNWSAGLVWGGLSLACMIGLGITGATQRSFVARWGFNRWRFVHFAMGVLVILFVLIHMVADGSHFAPIRQMFFGASTNDAGITSGA